MRIKERTTANVFNTQTRLIIVEQESRMDSIKDNEDQRLASVKITQTISASDLEKAKKARRFHHIFGHISSRKLKQMIKANLLINLDKDITAEAIDNANKHLGPCPGCLTNIKVRKPTSSQRPLTVKKGEALHCDIMFVRTNARGKLIPIHFTVDEATLNLFGSILPTDFNGDNLKEAQLKAVYYYKALKCQVLAFHYDRDKVVGVSKDFLNSLGIALHATSAGQHERIAEVMTCVVQDKVRATVFSIAYTIHINFIEDLTLHTMDVINFMPNSKTDIPPFCVFRPEQIFDVNHLLKFGFGDIVMSANPKFQTGSTARLAFNESKSNLGMMLRMDLQTPGGLIVFNLESKARMSRDGRYNTVRTPLTQELRIFMNNMARTNAGTNSDIDIVDAKGRPISMTNDNSETVSSSNNLTKSALTEFPIENNDTIISARNLSRDDALENQKVDNSIPTENSVKEMGLSGEDYSSKETLTTSTLMNNPDRERKSEQHIKLCGSPNFTKPHGLLQSSPIGPNTNFKNGDTIRTPLTQELGMVINNMTRTNAGTNSDIDIVDAKGKPLTLAVGISDTFTSSNNLTKNAPIEFPIENEDTVSSTRNLSRDSVLNTQKVDKSIPTKNSEKKDESE